MLRTCSFSEHILSPPIYYANHHLWQDTLKEAIFRFTHEWQPVLFIWFLEVFSFMWQQVLAWWCQWISTVCSRYFEWNIWNSNWDGKDWEEFIEKQNAGGVSYGSSVCAININQTFLWASYKKVRRRSFWLQKKHVNFLQPRRETPEGMILIMDNFVVSRIV